MTSDAKIGLLLGLIFIFVIAFIINGLPRFQGVKNSSELTTTMVSAQNGTLGIGGNERKVQEDFDRPAPANEQPRANAEMPIENKEDIRFTMKLPQETSVITETAIVETAGEAEPTSTQSVEPAAPATPQEKVQVNKSEPVKPAPPKEYTVSEGDTLAEIAKKFYGPEEGNKRAGVMRIFEANRQLLKSPDQIPVGQKLTIPSPGASPPDASKNESVFSGSIFEKAISIGRKHLSPDSGSALRKESPGLISPPKGSKGKPAAEYLVQEGDSLSRIAAQQLGDANRYPEIAKLNADTLTDEDSLTVGMRLKMPAR